MRNMGFAAELVEVQRRLRQGLGRLVRREGVQGRRIWILDGRLVNPANSTRFEDVRRPLKAYLKRGRI
jgi:Rad3-related DNA helicase